MLREQALDYPDGAGHALVQQAGELGHAGKRLDCDASRLELLLAHAVHKSGDSLLYVLPVVHGQRGSLRLPLADRIRQGIDPFGCLGRHGHHGDAEHRGQLAGVYGEALAGLVDLGQRQDGRHAELYDLQAESDASGEVCGIHDHNDGIVTAEHEVVDDYFLIFGVPGQRIRARKVVHDDGGPVADHCALFELDRGPRVVGSDDPYSGQSREKR